MHHYTYLLLDLFVILVPFIASFFFKDKFYRHWKFLFPSIFITGAFFITWDILFTVNGIWGFNEAYLTGIQILHLPLEEWLFFVAVPYSCTFTYFAFRVLIAKDPMGRFARNITLFLFAACVSLTITHIGQHYTFFTCLFTALFLGLHLWRWNSAYLGWFYLSYLVILVPFILSNGVLTGLEFWNYPLINAQPDLVADQVVWYNNDHNIGVRLFSIPVDDAFYSLLLQGMTITLFEYFSKRYSAGKESVAATA